MPTSPHHLLFHPWFSYPGNTPPFLRGPTWGARRRVSRNRRTLMLLFALAGKTAIVLTKEVFLYRVTQKEKSCVPDYSLEKRLKRTLLLKTGISSFGLGAKVLNLTPFDLVPGVQWYSSGVHKVLQAFWTPCKRSPLKIAWKRSCVECLKEEYGRGGEGENRTGRPDHSCIPPFRPSSFLF